MIIINVRGQKNYTTIIHNTIGFMKITMLYTPRQHSTLQNSYYIDFLSYSSFLFFLIKHKLYVLIWNTHCTIFNVDYIFIYTCVVFIYNRFKKLCFFFYSWLQTNEFYVAHQIHVWSASCIRNRVSVLNFCYTEKTHLNGDILFHLANKKKWIPFVVRTFVICP